MFSAASVACSLNRIGGPLKLLLIEDDHKIAVAVARGLRAEGYTVDHVGDGLEGQWRAVECRHDLIILDLLLPGRNGFAVCAAVRAAGIATPILMLTAKDGDLDEAEGLDTGADDYLTKPFSFPVLIARVAALLRRCEGRPMAQIAVGDLIIDPASRTARRAEADIALTAREFDVLAHLVRRGTSVTSKSDILDAVWSSDFQGDPNIVEVYVRRLRLKVDVPFGRSTIRTMRGAGYLMTDDDG